MGVGTCVSVGLTSVEKLSCTVKKHTNSIIKNGSKVNDLIDIYLRFYPRQMKGQQGPAYVIRLEQPKSNAGKCQGKG